VNFYNTLYLNHQNTDEDIFALDQLAVKEPPESTQDAEDEEPDVITNPEDDSKNESPLINYLPLIGIVGLLILTVAIVFVIKRRHEHPVVGETDSGEEDEENE
jgi:hypothetical protein